MAVIVNPAAVLEGAETEAIDHIKQIYVENPIQQEVINLGDDLELEGGGAVGMMDIVNIGSDTASDVESDSDGRKESESQELVGGPQVVSSQEFEQSPKSPRARKNQKPLKKSKSAELLAKKEAIYERRKKK